MPSITKIIRNKLNENPKLTTQELYDYILNEGFYYDQIKAEGWDSTNYAKLKNSIRTIRNRVLKKPSDKKSIDPEKFITWILKLDPKEHPMQAGLIKRLKKHGRPAFIYQTLELLKKYHKEEHPY